VELLVVEGAATHPANKNETIRPNVPSRAKNGRMLTPYDIRLIMY
jgi:hypothetical protein